MTLATRQVYANPWISVSESDVLTPAKTKGIYGLVKFRNVAVGVVALDQADRILLVGQYRYALRSYSWEIPEGGCPLGTSPLSTAKRELVEETGYRAKRWKKLITLHLSNSVTDERAEIFLAEGLAPGASAPEDTEELEVIWLPFSEALKQVKAGVITDAISVAAIYAVAAGRTQSAGRGARKKSFDRGAVKQPRRHGHRGKSQRRR
jgi:8-oxo-dGTP pyrophosphatase MutT (NUDIX family)